MTGAVLWCFACCFFGFFSLAATPYSAETAAGGQVVTGTGVHADAKQWSQSQSFQVKWGGRGGFNVRARQGELGDNAAATWYPSCCSNVRFWTRWEGKLPLNRRNPWAGLAHSEPELQGAWPSFVSVSSVFRTWRERADWHWLQGQPDVVLDRGPLGVSWSCERSARGLARMGPCMKVCFCPKVCRSRWRRTKWRQRFSHSRGGFLWTDKSQNWAWLSASTESSAPSLS